MNSNVRITTSETNVFIIHSFEKIQLHSFQFPLFKIINHIKQDNL